MVSNGDVAGYPLTESIFVSRRRSQTVGMRFAEPVSEEGQVLRESSFPGEVGRASEAIEREHMTGVDTTDIRR